MDERKDNQHIAQRSEQENKTANNIHSIHHATRPPDFLSAGLSTFCWRPLIRQAQDGLLFARVWIKLLWLKEKTQQPDQKNQRLPNDQPVAKKPLNYRHCAT